MQDEKDLQQQQEQIELPENAFRPLKEGEKYVPILRPEKNYPEVTRSLSGTESGTSV